MTPGSGGAASTPQWYQPAIGIFSHLINPPKKKPCRLFLLPPEGGVLRTPVLVLSPRNYPQDNFLPPEGASTLNMVRTLRGATIH